MTRCIGRSNRFGAVAALVVVAQLPVAGQAHAKEKCREGQTAGGACVSSALARSMRHRAVVFTQPKLSHTGAPVAQSRGESQDTGAPRAIERTYDKYGAPLPQPTMPGSAPTGPATPPPTPPAPPPAPPTPPPGPPPITSDIRLKRDISRLSCLDRGICLYRFRYRGDATFYVGVMAQEVARIVPDAVVHGPDGYLRVRYDRLGLTFQTWDAWILSAQAGSLPMAQRAASNGR